LLESGDLPAAKERFQRATDSGDVEAEVRDLGAVNLDREFRRTSVLSRWL
jgi:hypothetical protein